VRRPRILLVGVFALACAPSAQPTPTPAPAPPKATTAAASPTVPTAHRWNFDTEATGTLPTGAEVFDGAWAIRAEPDAPSQPNAMCQTGQADFPALGLGGPTYTDLVMSTRFRPISGRVDQAAGLIFRVQDRANYYILRANALENNVDFYIWRGGRRSMLREGPVQVPSGQWQELRLEAQVNRFRGFLNGLLVVEAMDDTFRGGGVGLWTKADSVSCFDDVAAEAR
jgi:hypothetical protein